MKLIYDAHHPIVLDICWEWSFYMSSYKNDVHSLLFNFSPLIIFIFKESDEAQE